MGLKLVVDEVVLGFALLAAVLAREPLVAVGLRVHIEHMLAQVGRGGVHAAAQGALRSVAHRRPARESRPCNTEAAVRHRSVQHRLSAMVSVSVAAVRGRGGVAPPLFDAVYRVHVYLHVLAGLERLAADGARVRELVRGVHVQDVLLEVAIVAVQLAALGARGPAGLTVGQVGGPLGPLVGRGPVPAARPGRSWGRRGLRQCALLHGTRLCFDGTVI